MQPHAFFAFLVMLFLVLYLQGCEPPCNQGNYDVCKDSFNRMREVWQNQPASRCPENVVAASCVNRCDHLKLFGQCIIENNCCTMQQGDFSSAELIEGLNKEWNCTNIGHEVEFCEED
mmetsp:Transcript_129636/g.242506  ORF Transcript_129636/g.242506 Transcript_129636/m.242506 type:complete len:118 (+) Transcript_129636:87-440(+)